jgi:RHS repeat-associated protein
MVFDETGSLASVKRRDYLPFGEELAVGLSGRSVAQGYSGDGVRQQFTNNERDQETGLDYVRHRYYSNLQGRFLSKDPLMRLPSRFNPQRWNRYSYVINNPLKFIDPSGLQQQDPQVDNNSKKPKKVVDDLGRKHEMVLVKVKPWKEATPARPRPSFGDLWLYLGQNPMFSRIQFQEPPEEESIAETPEEREEEDLENERMSRGELDLESGQDLIDEIDRMLAAEQARVESEMRFPE